MALNAMQQLILETLSEQAEGYLTSPDAAAFFAKGMENADDVEKELMEMAKNEWVEFYTVTDHVTLMRIEKDEAGEPVLAENGHIQPILDDDGQPQFEEVEIPADQGWVITDKGRAALNE